MTQKSEEMGFPPEGTEAPFQGTTSEEREAFGRYSRLEADPRDPAAGEEAGRIARHSEKEGAGG